MSRSSRGRSAAGVPLPVAHPPAEHVELDHTIDIVSGNSNKRNKSGGSKKKSSHRAQQLSSSDSDDPYESPPASTAGDQFYDSFAALELKIATGSQFLAHIIRILKQIRVHPDVADRLADELEDKLSETGALLSEIELIQNKFNGISSSANAKGKFSQEEKEKRASLRQRVAQDIQQMSQSYRQLRAASQQHVSSSNRNGSYDPYADEDPSHHSLLSKGNDSGSGDLLHYQSEYIGELDGHLAMLEEQARERATFMKAIERDVVQVHKLFQDVNFMVNEQQRMVDDIDEKIAATQENAKQGMEQLLQAQQYQAAKRKKMCFLVLVGVIVMLIFLLFLWVAFGGR